MKRGPHLKLRLCGATGTSREHGTLGATIGPPAAKKWRVVSISGSPAAAFKGAGHAGSHHGPACSKEMEGIGKSEGSKAGGFQTAGHAWGHHGPACRRAAGGRQGAFQAQRDFRPGMVHGWQRSGATQYTISF